MARTAPKKLESSKKYTDAPRYQVTYGYEDSFKNMFNKVTKAMVQDIETKAKAMVRKK